MVVFVVVVVVVVFFFHAVNPIFTLLQTKCFSLTYHLLVAKNNTMFVQNLDQSLLVTFTSFKIPYNSLILGG